MKILILQLARLGDVYMTWPVVRALKRQNPGCEVHMLVRPRFQAACNGLEALDRVHLLPTEKILSPLIKPEFDLESSLNCVDEIVETLAAEKYDRIVNLSFSPVSSYLASFLGPSAQVSGFSRHSDGYLHLTDDVSRYFWAQVGPGFPNRVHIVDLFGGVAGVDFAPEDFRLPQVELTKPIEGDYFVLHIGASEQHKQVSPGLWSRLITEFESLRPGMKWVLIGSSAEREIAQQLEKSEVGDRILNRVGQTELHEIFSYLQYSQGLIGADSAPMHMIPFVDQKALCLSLGHVKFWETGPITLGSAILRLQSEMEISAQDLARLVKEWSEEKITSRDTRVYRAVEAIPRFENSTQETHFAWDLVRALYMGAAFPINSDMGFYKACLRMFEANQVAVENLQKRTAAKREILTSILDRVDELFFAIVKQEPSTVPFFRWYQAEKTRIQPGSFEQIAQDTLIIHEVFHSLLKKYLLEEDVRRVEMHGNL
ncbi:MAG: glycosyltransferase family 9 protein [Bdellovibrionales bacterium]